MPPEGRDFMPDKEQSNQSDFMIEKIKVRPINRKKLVRRTIITAAMAVIFGLIACFTFLLLEPVINKWLYPEEKPKIVVLPEDQEEMAPEDMLAENLPTESPSPTPEPTPDQETEPGEEITLEEQILAILSENPPAITRDNYKQLYDSMSSYVKELNAYMVTITIVVSNVDWFNDIQESRNQISGVIVAENGKELLVLSDALPVRSAQRLLLTFWDGTQVEAQIKQQDKVTNLAILSVELDSLPDSMKEQGLPIASLGASNYRNLPGTPVVALGSPMGVSNSVGYGMVTSTGIPIYSPDRNYKLLLTDIFGSQNGGGVLFNMNGQVIGIITSSKNTSDLKNAVTAYGITELKKIIEKMSNGSSLPYMGISGLDVTREANEELGVPLGAFVKDIDLNSPAMQAGIQKGDVVIEAQGLEILTFNDYTNALLTMEPGDTMELVVMRQSQNDYKEMNFSVELKESKM